MWRCIEGFEDYQVSNDGKVRSMKCHRMKILKPCNRDKWPAVTLYNKDGRCLIYLHRLVAQAFVPNPNNYPHVRHKSDDTTNCRADNLYWCEDTHGRREAV